MAESFVKLLTKGCLIYCDIYSSGSIFYMRDRNKDPGTYWYGQELSLIMLEDRCQFLYIGGFFLFQEALYECSLKTDSDAFRDPFRLTRIDIREFNARKITTNAVLKQIGLIPDLVDIILDYYCLTKSAEFFPKYRTDTVKDTANLNDDEKKVLHCCRVPLRLFATNHSTVFSERYYLPNISLSNMKQLITDGFLVRC